MTSLETAYAGGSGNALKTSEQLDAVIADIMARRGTVSQILQADAAFCQ